VKCSRLCAGIVAGFLLYLGTASVQAAPAGDAAPVQTTLANGMKVVLLVDRLAPVTTTVMTYGVGSDDDTMPGIAHATEHMLFRGTADVSAGQFAIIANRAGADYNAQTDNMATTYYFNIPSSYTGIALHLEADRMNGALVRQSDWQTERGAIEQEVRAHESVPGAPVLDKMRHAIFGDTPYAIDGVGTIPSFQKMQAADIAAFYHAWYHPNNATLVVSGDIDVEQTLAEIHRDFDGIASVPLPPHKTYSVLPMASTTISDSIAEMPIPVGVSVYRFPVLGSADYDAAKVLTTALYSGSGALAQLQTKGKILGGIVLQSAARDVGTEFVAGFGIPGDTATNVHAQLEAALDQYRLQGLPPDLFTEAKLRLLSDREYSQASISGLAFDWASSLANSGTGPDQDYATLEAVTPADVSRVMKTYMDPKSAVVVLLQPKPSAAIARTGGGSTAEDVQFTPEKDEPLPAWALPYFRAPLRVPQSDRAIRTFRLSNGLTLTVRPEHLSPTIVLEGIVEDSPALYEPRGKDGVDGIASALLDWGTTSYDRSRYQAQLDSIAANCDLGSSFSLTVEAKNFDRAVQLLADGMMHPAFSPSAFAIMKSNTARTLAAVAGQPRTLASIAQIDALYPPGDPRRRRATVATVSAIALPDVKKWYEFAYRPDVTTIAIVGDVSPDTARATIEKWFGTWRNPRSKRPTFVYPQINPRKNTKTDVTVNSPSTTHSEVTLTQPLGVRPGTRDAVALELANTMLSEEGTGSILFRDLRTTHGYVYSVDSSMDVGYSGSTFSIDFAADSKNVPRAQAAAVAEIRHLQEAPVADVELQRAKALLLAQRVLPLDSYGGIASDILSTAREGLSVSDQDLYWGELLTTTPQQVRAAMLRWIHADRFSRVILAPGE
jgi:zinc protease